MKSLVDCLHRVQVGEPCTHRGLTMYPVFDPADVPPTYLTLSEALAAGSARVTEISHAGTVPELAFVNDGDAAVLLLDGEQLVGAKQNRILNLTILAPARARIVIPVSCVEQGRWHHVRPDFATSEDFFIAELRALKTSGVSESLARSRKALSPQGQIWSGIAKRMTRSKTHSPSGAMGAIYDAERPILEEFVRSIPPQRGQNGAIFALAGEIYGGDLFASSDTLRRTLPKLVRSFALEAIATGPAATMPSATGVRDFLRAAGDVAMREYPAVGLGTDVRITSPGIAGAALVVDHHPVHVTLFRVYEGFGFSREGLEGRGSAPRVDPASRERSATPGPSEPGMVRAALRRLRRFGRGA